jgi:serine/threonine protein phosphatase 1
MKEYVIGDIHGGYKALLQVLEKSGFDYENDKLIVLGDVCDGWSEVAESIEELLKIKNLVYCMGNHDDWTLKHIDNPSEGYAWYEQGGKATVDSYIKNPDLKERHINFLRNANLYYIDDKNRLFLHAGFNIDYPIDVQHKDTYFWTREFWQYLQIGYSSEHVDIYDEIYIGHTPTISKWKDGKPVNIRNVYNMDTGATYVGKLSMMNLNTKELFQSDPVFMLYPDERGRNGELLINNPNWKSIWGIG